MDFQLYDKLYGTVNGRTEEELLETIDIVIKNLMEE